jgi:hypothetical protein
MHPVSTASLLVLLACVIAAPLAAQSPLTMGISGQRPAGCHGEGSKVPAPPEPVNHQCCQSGHDAVLMQKAHAEPVVVRPTLAAAGEPLPCRPFDSQRVYSLIQSGDPPGLTILRI